MSRSMSLKAKLIIPAMLMAIVATTVGGIGYYALGKVEHEYSGIVQAQVPDIQAANEMFLAFREIRIGLRTLGLSGISKEEQAEAVRQTLAAIAKYEETAKAYENTKFTTEEEALYAKVKAEWVKFKQVGTRVLALQKSGSEDDQRQMLEIFLKDCPASAKVFTAAIHDIVAYHDREMTIQAQAANTTAARANLTSLLAIVIGVLSGLVASWFAIANLVREITGVARSLETGANGMGRVAQELTETSQTLSASSTQQAAAIQETTASMEETSAMVAKNAENARRSMEIAENSRGTAGRGKGAVKEVISSIEEIARANGAIAQQVNQTNVELSDVVKMIQEIGTKTKVINDIVFQTKLLSFNASVEAARAGEQGKGFAVVAEEVGNLAQMSGNSAKEISELLEVSTRRVESMVAETKARVAKLVTESEEKVRRGTETARHCDEVLSEIVDDVQKVGGLVSEITSASDEQARGVAEVNKAIAELDSAAQQNSQASSRGAASAEQLNQEMLAVRDLIVSLNGIVYGSAGKAEPSRVNPAHSAEVLPFRGSRVNEARAPRKIVGGLPLASDPAFEDV